MSTWSLLNCSNMTDLSRSSAWTSALCGSETLKMDPPPQRAGEDGGRHKWASKGGQSSEGCDLFQMTLNYPFVPLTFLPSPTSPKASTTTSTVHISTKWLQFSLFFHKVPKSHSAATGKCQAQEHFSAKGTLNIKTVLRQWM